ncbi:phosphate/phosphite/phosphonate ABC transporter substrate-binding protein [Meiothermus taiwanensis]|jgi:phosphonate transport system substrate-binding protein|uniref:Phosphate-import protein PhnD n=2 Tax=Meiothermus taiwanensis TaxID=172827 RepID=A0A399DTJ5_9DEIN|nr:phosphate/phosphite/phosphonate ABC transporter substrate-binding protein [Meiothermus taiwanensis]AWR87368.1 phosphonate ABC transporter, periplasmic phosphonate-binding protein [Meiothermus taiwanensis WR-220]KIQ53505.1 phosphonate ABC transporter substrate-binding protein [Meiothermus taiwanensis]KZK15714.1 phosphonate ABC transporter substrate-binding protein [Meiothermus taiwanensis]RIH74458.1 Phosphate-import protein PhnD [Meiothermus taiwanensis]
MKRSLFLLLALLMFGLSVGLAQNPVKVRIGFNPTQNSDQLRPAAQAIADYLERRFQGAIEVEIFIPTEYRGLIEAMRGGNLDFAFFPPDGYVIANQDVGAQVLLKSVRGNSPYYWSAIIVRKDSGIKNVRDLEGKTIAWVDKNSAAGYVFPRAALVAEKIDPDKLFSKQTFAGRHDAAVLAVLNKSVDAAATFANDNRNKSGAWTQFLKPEEAAQLTAIFYSKPIPGDTFSVSKQFYAKYPTLSRGIAAALQGIKTPESKLLFNLYRIDYMIPAQDSDYDVVRQARKVAGQ